MGFFFKKPAKAEESVVPQWLAYKKGEIDFGTIPTQPAPHGVRYQQDGRIWKQVSPAQPVRPRSCAQAI